MAKTVTVGKKEYPAVWAICTECEGNGTISNPRFDNVNTNDFCIALLSVRNIYCNDEDICNNEDEESCETCRIKVLASYANGDYDLSCPTCNGSGKTLIPATEEGLEALELELAEEAEWKAYQNHELQAEEHFLSNCRCC